MLRTGSPQGRLDEPGMRTPLTDSESGGRHPGLALANIPHFKNSIYCFARLFYVAWLSLEANIF
jgi:hypothetical protein